MLLNEQTHKKGKKFFKNLGIILDIVAALLIIGGIVIIVVGKGSGSSDMADTNWFNSTSSAMLKSFVGGAMIMFGVILLVVSIIMYVIAYRREMMAFGVSSVMPVVDDTVEHVANNTSHSIGKAVSNIVKPVVESIADPIAESVAKAKGTSTPKRHCQECGEIVTKEAKFCKHCGVALSQQTTCPKCNATIEENTKFCPHCGEKL